MAQAIVTVLLVILFAAYAIFFALWNPAMVEVVGFYDGTNAWGAPVPLFVLPLAGMAIGAILMAIAMVAPWRSVRRDLAQTRERLAEEERRSTSRGKTIRDLRQQLGRPQMQVGPAERTAEEQELSDVPTDDV